MGQTPSLNDFSSDSNEAVQVAEDTTATRGGLTNSEDRAESTISPDTFAAGSVRSTFNQNTCEMSQSQRLKVRLKKRQRVRPYRADKLNIVDRIVEDSSNRVINKPSRNQDRGDLFGNQPEIEIEPTLPNEAEHGFLVRANPLQNSLLHIQMDSNSVSERVTGQELPPIPLIKVEEPFDLNMKDVSPSQVQNILKPLLDVDGPSSRSNMLPATTRKLANNLIKLSRSLKTPDLTELCCLDCGFIPVQPVTGQCGHTRCRKCILSNGDCPCSANAPRNLFLNTVVQEIIEKMMNIKQLRPTKPASSRAACNGEKKPHPEDEAVRLRKRRQHSLLRLTPVETLTNNEFRPRMPMTIQARYRRARHLIDVGRTAEAAAHLARVAASSERISRCARVLLHQILTEMCNIRRRRKSIPRRLRQFVREQSAHSWLKPSDLECVLCTETYSSPVATPCGHTYCRECLERCMSFKKRCALCLRSLENFNVYNTQDTVFITSILSSIDVLPWRTGTDVIPVVICHVAYPGIPFPLFVFNPRHCRMVQRELQSGSRRFGMLAYNLAAYGTILEIRDCILFEDGRCIVSTVGVSRFRVLERFVENGCDVARVRALSDLAPGGVMCGRELHMLAVQVHSRAVDWLESIRKRSESVIQEIETAFGKRPADVNPEDVETADGPAWLWWVITVMPLNREIKFLILSTRSLLKRVLAVSRALELVDSGNSSKPVSNNVEEELLSSS